MTKNTLLTIVITFVGTLLIVLGYGYIKNQSFSTLGGSAGGLLAENYIPYIQYNGGYNTAKSIKTTGDLTVGSAGTALSQVAKGNCNLSSLASEYPTIMVASSSALFTCTATGVVAGDPVFVTPNVQNTSTATTTWSAFGLGSFAGVAGIEFGGASSTAADTITVTLWNKTGVATSSFSQATSSWSYIYFH